MGTSEQDDRIAHFLSVYVYDGKTGGCLPPFPPYIKDAIDVILSAGVMTQDELRREALKGWNVIIPADYFPQGETHG